MRAWQKCPVCDGTGLTYRPPYVAGDTFYFSSSAAGPYTCGCCSGQRIIHTETGLPPLLHNAVEAGVVEVGSDERAIERGVVAPESED